MILYAAMEQFRIKVDTKRQVNPQVIQEPGMFQVTKWLLRQT